MYLPIFPHRGLLPRDSGRGDILETVALKAYSYNVPEWLNDSFEREIRDLGYLLRVDTEHDGRWRDFRDVDVVLCTHPRRPLATSGESPRRNSLMLGGLTQSRSAARTAATSRSADPARTCLLPTRQRNTLRHSQHSGESRRLCPVFVRTYLRGHVPMNRHAFSTRTGRPSLTRVGRTGSRLSARSCEQLPVECVGKSRASFADSGPST